MSKFCILIALLTGAACTENEPDDPDMANSPDVPIAAVGDARVGTDPACCPQEYESGACDIVCNYCSYGGEGCDGGITISCVGGGWVEDWHTEPDPSLCVDVGTGEMGG